MISFTVSMSNCLWVCKFGLKPSDSKLGEETNKAVTDTKSSLEGRPQTHQWIPSSEDEIKSTEMTPIRSLKVRNIIHREKLT